MATRVATVTTNSATTITPRNIWNALGPNQQVYMRNYSYECYFICLLESTEMKQANTEICYRFFINLANSTRLAALEQLMQKPMSVNELATSLRQEQSMISHNLKPLLECNLIAIKRQGKKHVYTVNEETIRPIFGVIENHAKKYCPTGGKCLKGGK